MMLMSLMIVVMLMMVVVMMVNVVVSYDLDDRSSTATHPQTEAAAAAGGGGRGGVRWFLSALKEALLLCKGSSLSSWFVSTTILLTLKATKTPTRTTTTTTTTTTLSLSSSFSSSFTTTTTGCQSSLDCSMLGRCVNQTPTGDVQSWGSCECLSGWKGLTCQTLDLMPVDVHHAGLKVPDLTRSTWGGSVLYDSNTQLYHMFASEIINDCGLYSWTTNSRVIRATSSTPNGPYTRQEVIVPIFAHEPNIIRAPTGEIVLFVTALKGVRPRDCRNTTTTPTLTTTTSSSSFSSSSVSSPLPPPKDTYMLWASSPNGPWSDPVMVLNSTQWNVDYWNRQKAMAICDSNLNGIILKDDNSFLGIWRRCETDDLRTVPHLLTASNWKDPTTYTPHVDTPLMNVGGAGAEDPSQIWTTKIDNVTAYHVVFHDEQLTRCMEGQCGASGRHAWSLDGKVWQYATNENAYDRFIDFVGPGGGEGTTTVTANTRARPHLIMDPTNDNRPIALSTGLKETDESGYVWTLVQMMKTKMKKKDYMADDDGGIDDKDAVTMEEHHNIYRKDHDDIMHADNDATSSFPYDYVYDPSRLRLPPEVARSLLNAHGLEVVVTGATNNRFTEGNNNNVDGIYLTFENNNKLNSNRTQQQNQQQHCMVRWPLDGRGVGQLVDHGNVDLCAGTPHGLTLATEADVGVDEVTPGGDLYLYHANNEQVLTKTSVATGKIVWQNSLLPDDELDDSSLPYRPTWIAVPPSGPYMYLCDGYGSNLVYLLHRVLGNFVRNQNDGNRIVHWGGRSQNDTNPNEHGTFATNHGCVYDPLYDQIVVADREHGRLEYFDYRNGPSNYGQFRYSHTTNLRRPTTSSFVPSLGNASRPCILRRQDYETGTTGLPSTPLKLLPQMQQRQKTHRQSTEIGGTQGHAVVADLQGSVAILNSNNTIVKIIQVAEELGNLGHLHPHDARILPNGDVIVATWNPGRLSFWQRVFRPEGHARNG